MNEDKILNKLVEQTKILVKHSKILDEHSMILGEQGKILKEHSKILEEHSQQFDRVFIKLVDHEARLERIEQNMVTKQELREVSSNLSNKLDKIVQLFEKKDQEMTIMGYQIQRVENDVEKIKPLVGLR